MDNLKRKNTLAMVFIVLSYIPLALITIFNKSDFILGMPLAWFFYFMWSLYIFGVVVLMYRLLR